MTFPTRGSRRRRRTPPWVRAGGHPKRRRPAAPAPAPAGGGPTASLHTRGPSCGSCRAAAGAHDRDTRYRREAALGAPTRRPRGPSPPYAGEAPPTPTRQGSGKPAPEGATDHQPASPSAANGTTRPETTGTDRAARQPDPEPCAWPRRAAPQPPPARRRTAPASGKDRCASRRRTRPFPPTAGHAPAVHHHARPPRTERHGDGALPWPQDHCGCDVRPEDAGQQRPFSPPGPSTAAGAGQRWRPAPGPGPKPPGSPRPSERRRGTHYCCAPAARPPGTGARPLGAGP